jgi:CheY-like chemotaxis protein/signal transduction histidine kinase/HAMP domain-containing protein
MKINSRKSIRTKLSRWLLLLTLVPLIFVLVITYFQRVDVIEARTFDKLTAIRDLKVQQLSNWLNERVGDMYVVSSDKDLMDLKLIINNTNDNEKSNAIRNKLRHHLQRYFKFYPDYYDLSIINPQNGKIIASTKEFMEGKDVSLEYFFTEVIEKRELVIQDIYFSQELANPTMSFSTPIFASELKKGEIIGVLVARINLHNSLYRLLLNRVGLGQTGETLIVNSVGIALNELRWYENAPLNLSIFAEPAVNAMRGKTGFSITADYREVEVLAAYTHIPELSWGFVCKQDVYELNSPVRNMMRDYLILFIIITIVVFVFVFSISNSISTPIVEVYNVAQQIKAGNYSVRNIIRSKDELGSLSEEFNNMADVIESKMKIQKGVADISETMIEKTSMKDFGSELLAQLMRVTDAKMCVFYILNENESQFEYFTSIGANQELLKPFSASHPEGEFGNTIINKSISYLHDIPENTVFKFRTTAGDIIPKEIITIPIIVEGNVIAIVSLVNIHKFNHDCKEIIELSWRGINTSYSNLIASERTSVFAEHLSRINQQLEVQSEELKDQTVEMQEQAKELQRTSAELQEQNYELETQRQQVEVANKLKSEFLSNMSHELRTPLNSIMALSRVLIMQAKGKLDEDENSYLEIIERNGKRLLSLINDILDLSKIEAGKMDIIPEFISVNSLVNTIKDNLQSLSDEKNISLILNYPSEMPLVETDEFRLHQVLLNVASNAVKFTEKGSVEISVEFDELNVYFKLKDTGIGILPSVLPHIFDEFRQGDGTSSRQYQGTGLGLAIAKKIIHILGGNITVESEYSKGSVFTINLPILWHESNQIAKSSDNKINTIAKTKNTILIIDDDLQVIKEMSNLFIGTGFNIISAQSGIEGLRLANKHKPFAITLDILMPEMDGWEVLQKLKESEKTKDIPVIVVSASPDKETGFALGAIGFVNKPIDKVSLFSEINLIKKLPEFVMVVDDDMFQRNQIANIIEQNKIKTILASGGKECIDLLKEKIPDILVLDILMPDMDGISVLENIRNNETTKYLPVIIVTAKDLTKEDKMKLNGRVSSVITKSESSSEQVFEEIIRIIKELEARNDQILKDAENNKKRILMVEDNPAAIVQIKKILEKENYCVDVAMGGQQAIDFLETTIPDGIILDLMMPDINGFEVLKRIRNIEDTQNLPVLILTAKDLTSKEVEELSSSNFQQIINKGDIDIDGLLFKLESMFENTSQNSLIKSNLQKEKINSLPLILIVEDNYDNMITLKAILKGKYGIISATDGREGLKMANNLNPDLILLDMSLPEISGKEIVQLLKQNSETKNIPVIAVTAQAMRGDKESFLEVGCDDYVSKPVDPKLIKNKLEEWLNKG